jgi:hypothetical protein
MGLGIAIILCAVAVGLVAQTASAAGGGLMEGRGGVIWGAVNFVLSSFGSLFAWLVKPYVFPEALVVHPGLFAKKLSTGMMIMSWSLDRAISYGPLIIVTAAMIFLVIGKPQGGPRRPGRNVNWRQKIR